MKVTPRSFLSAIGKIQHQITIADPEVPIGIPLTDAELLSLHRFMGTWATRNLPRTDLDLDKEYTVVDELLDTPVPLFVHCISETHARHIGEKQLSWCSGYEGEIPFEKFFKIGLSETNKK